MGLLCRLGAHVPAWGSCAGLGLLCRLGAFVQAWGSCAGLGVSYKGTINIVAAAAALSCGTRWEVYPDGGVAGVGFSLVLLGCWRKFVLNDTDCLNNVKLGSPWAQNLTFPNDETVKARTGTETCI